MSAMTATSVSSLYLRAANWAIGSDPGLLRLRMAARTTLSLAADDVVSAAVRAAHVG